jgi:hypothetical protein
VKVATGAAFTVHAFNSGGTLKLATGELVVSGDYTSTTPSVVVEKTGSKIRLARAGARQP